MRISLCFPCRRLVVPYIGSDRCDGRCGGGCDSAAAWHAECWDCFDWDAEEDDGALMDGWSCFDEGCVLAWVAKNHPDCAEISHGSPLWTLTPEMSDVV
jgi:hypothetical protein